jgi:acyl-CoA oxidase
MERLQTALNPSPTTALLSTRLFQSTFDELSRQELTNRAYARARAIGKAYGGVLCIQYKQEYLLTQEVGMQPEDVLSMTPKFWQLHLDLIFVMDMAASTLITIQYNLVAGTVALFAAERPDLQMILKELLDFNVK